MNEHVQAATTRAAFQSAGAGIHSRSLSVLCAACAPPILHLTIRPALMVSAHGPRSLRRAGPCSRSAEATYEALTRRTRERDFARKTGLKYFDQIADKFRRGTERQKDSLEEPHVLPQSAGRKGESHGCTEQESRYRYAKPPPFRVTPGFAVVRHAGILRGLVEGPTWHRAGLEDSGAPHVIPSEHLQSQTV